jgi:hypothetical protein
MGPAALLLVAACGRIAFDARPDLAVDASTDAALVCHLDPSWTPEWSQVVEYLPLDGAGAIADGEPIAAAIGGDAAAANADGTGMAFVAGKVGQAVSLDGVDDAFTFTAAAIDTTAGHAVTIAFWMNWNGAYYSVALGWTVVLDIPDPMMAFPGGYHLTFVSQGTPALGFNTGNSDMWGVADTGLGNRWGHVAAVFVNGTSSADKLYLDGALQSLTQTLGSAHAESVHSAIRVGAKPMYPSFFAGAIDEFAIWNVELNAAEIAALVAAPSRCP